MYDVRVCKLLYDALGSVAHHRTAECVVTGIIV